MPTPEQIDRAIAEMKKLYANYEYFFQKNDSPEWVEPLWERDFFKNPPKPVDDEKGYRSFPLWPESHYLVRMAPKSPDLVAKILKALPATENIYVHSDVVEAALALPGPLAAELAERERKWIRSQSQLLWLLPDRYTDLVVHLAARGEAEAAFKLARTLLDVVPDPRFADQSEEELKFATREPVAKMPHWDYERAVEKMRPALQQIDDLRSLKLLADLLQKAMNLAEPPRDGDYSDHSYIWRPAVEDHAQNMPEYSIRDALVAGLRDVAEAICRDAPDKVPAVVDELEGRKRSIFQRVALHVLALFGGAAPGLATGRLADWALLEEVAVRHEYVQLAQAHFKELSEEQTDELLNHLRTPPTMGENYRRNFAAIFGRAATDEDIERAKVGWELEKLAALRGLLPERWQRRYEELLAGRAEPKHPEFPSYIESGWVGPTSPKSASEIIALPIDELIDFLRNWKASGDPFGPSEEGLGRELAAAVEADPERFAPHADRFGDLDPTYARSLLDGFEKAVGHDRAFSWTKVLALCEHVVAQPFEPDVESEHGALSERDPGWRWARGSVADLLEEGFGRDRVPIEERDRAWPILRKVTDDPNPTPEHEAQYGGSNMDSLTLSLNTNRGKAMQALIRYALWVRRSDEKAYPERVAKGFDAMPEVREVLDAHLDPANDPSLAVRAVYGQWFPWLVLLDVGWARKNADRIFPGGVERSLHDAAWEAYLASAPYENVFEVLRHQYQAAVEELPTVRDEDDRRHFLNPSARLAEHLMILYLRGRLTFDEESRVLARFFEVAPEKTRAHAIQFLGRLLYKGEAPLTDAQIERLKDLWRQRFEAFVAAPESHREEVGGFGWWFASSEKIPDDWLIEQLLQVLEHRAPVDDAHGVIERLADLAPQRPYQAVRALRLMVPIQQEPGLLYGWREPTRRLISAALIADDDKAREEAADVLNELLARGYSDYDDLAKEQRQ